MTEINETIILRGDDVLYDMSYVAGPGLAGKPMILIEDGHWLSLTRLTLDCNNIAAAGISGCDMVDCDIEHVKILHPVVVGLYLRGLLISSRMIRVDGLEVECRERGPSTAAGVILDGSYDPNVNVCFSRFENLYLSTDEGHCLEIRDADNCKFEIVHCINLGNGYAIYEIARGHNRFEIVEPHLGKAHFTSTDNMVDGWSTINGGAPL